MVIIWTFSGPMGIKLAQNCRCTPIYTPTRRIRPFNLKWRNRFVVWTIGDMSVPFLCQMSCTSHDGGAVTASMFVCAAFFSWPHGFSLPRTTKHVIKFGTCVRAVDTATACSVFAVMPASARYATSFSALAPARDSTATAPKPILSSFHLAPGAPRKARCFDQGFPLFTRTRT